MFAENAGETALAHLGGLIAGASTVPVNFHLTTDETAYILRDSRTHVLFRRPGDPRTRHRRGPPGGGAARRRLAVPGDRRVVDWAEWLAAAPSHEASLDAVPRPNLLYTSGTTGLPKGTELPPTMFAGGSTVAEHLEG